MVVLLSEFGRDDAHRRRRDTFDESYRPTPFSSSDSKEGSAKTFGLLHLCLDSDMARDETERDSQQLDFGRKGKRNLMVHQRVKE